MPSAELGQTQKDDQSSLQQDGGPTVSRTVSPRTPPAEHEVDRSSPPSPNTVPAPVAHFLSVQVPSPPPLLVQLPPNTPPLT